VSDECLLMIESAHRLETAGVVVLPEAPAGAARFPDSRTISASLRRGGQVLRRIRVTLVWTHFDPGGYRLMCVVQDAEPEELEVGSEIWIEDEEA
jgi:hypothetical protein